jgi:sensor histidine kinase YesM
MDSSVVQRLVLTLPEIFLHAGLFAIFLSLSPKSKMKDTRLRIFGQVLINIVALCFFYPSSIIDGGISPLRLAAYVVLCTFVIWESLRICIYWSRKLFPGILLTRQRLSAVGISTLFIVAVSPFIRFLISDLLNLYGSQSGTGGSVYDYLRIIGQNIFYCLFISATYEAIYFFKEWKKSFREASELRQASLMSQVNSLKNQVNPHFLFNTLNSLTALIGRDSQKAEEFAQEMADVYRYMLRVNRHSLISLEEEIAFVRSYAILLQTRFNENLSIHIDITDDYLNHLLPPLTIQLLIENAVKHNVVSSRTPLRIDIGIKPGVRLAVKNRVQAKSEPVYAENTGLANISDRFRLLEIGDIEIQRDYGFFEVILPLLKPANHEYSDN